MRGLGISSWPLIWIAGGRHRRFSGRHRRFSGRHRRFSGSKVRAGPGTLALLVRNLQVSTLKNSKTYHTFLEMNCEFRISCVC
jgi:hypothetical protein